MKKIAIIFFVFLSTGYAETAKAACQSMPAAATKAPVTFCQNGFTVSVRVGSDTRHYPRAEFTTAWRDIAKSWLIAESLSPNLLKGASVEYWFSIPEANPLATQARIQISPRSGPRFLLAGSAFPEDWALPPARANIAILSHDRYPEDFGFRPGELLVLGASQARPEDVLQHLARYSEGPPSQSNGRWYTVPTKAFAEQSVNRGLTADPMSDDLVNAVYYNSLLEWIAYRERAFAFSWH